MAPKQRILDENESLLTLWHQAQAGDKDAFCQLAESQYRALFSYALNFTTDREFVKDSIQSVFIRVWEKRATITIQFVAIYLFKSLRNELFQEFRRQKQWFTAVDSLEVSELSDWQTVETEIEQQEAESESYQRIRRAISTLPKRHQEAIFLKFYEGLDNDQIAGLMHINRQSVANLLYKSLCALKSQMTFFTC